MTGNLIDVPLRHISIRVPWHDAGWAGLVCLAPQLNGACAKLKGIASAKNEETEKLIAGRSLEELRGISGLAVSRNELHSWPHSKWSKSRSTRWRK